MQELAGQKEETQTFDPCRRSHYYEVVSGLEDELGSGSRKGLAFSEHRDDRGSRPGPRRCVTYRTTDKGAGGVDPELLHSKALDTLLKLGKVLRNFRTPQKLGQSTAIGFIQLDGLRNAVRIFGLVEHQFPPAGTVMNNAQTLAAFRHEVVADPDSGQLGFLDARSAHLAAIFGA